MAPKRKRTLTSWWSQLPIDVLECIFKKLDSPVDAVSFGGVCKQWCHVALGTHMSLYCKLPMHHFVPRRSPLPMLLHPGCRGRNPHHLRSLNQGIRYKFRSQELSNKWIVGSRAGWLVTVDTVDRQINLLNPLTGKKISLPHVSTIPLYDAMVNQEDITSFGYIRKVIVGYYRGSVLIVAVVSLGQTIRFCRMGDLKWTRLERSPTGVEDIIIHNNKLYAINFFGGLFEIDIAESTNVTMVAALPCPPVVSTCHLVGLCGDQLVLVIRALRRCPRNRLDGMTSHIGVFKLAKDDFEHPRCYMSEAGIPYPQKLGHSWASLENLGNHVVFIGYNHSLSLDSRVYPNFKGNCIYFADYRSDNDWGRMRGFTETYHDVGVYRMEDGAVASFQHLSRVSSRMNMVWLSPSFSNEIEVDMIPQ